MIMGGVENIIENYYFNFKCEKLCMKPNNVIFIEFLDMFNKNFTLCPEKKSFKIFLQ